MSVVQSNAWTNVINSRNPPSYFERCLPPFETHFTIDSLNDSNSCMDINLTGKRALVSGSSSGIGAAVAQELASMGCQVTLLARDKDKLSTILKSLSGAGHSFIACDLSKSSEIQAQVEKALKVGPFQILICNAGGPPAGALIDAKEEDFLNVFQTHLLGNQKLAQLLVPGMKSSGYGRIVNIISTSVKAPIIGLGVSNAVRGAVANWSKTLSMELGEFGITVNNVLPGFTATPRLESLMPTMAKKRKISPEELRKEWIGCIPLRRIAKPNEVASAVAFLASPAASYISGINIPVDGGRTSSL
jgi:3-oxoacyl-[acyl-carrier protein] reductase